MARGRVEPTGFTAGRTISILGVTYALGAAIPTAVVARLRHASALLTRRLIIPSNALYPTKRDNDPVRRAKPHPYVLNGRERRNLGA